MNGFVLATSRVSSRLARILLLTSLVAAIAAIAPAAASATFGVSSFSVTPSTTVKSAHPNLNVSFTRSGTESDDLKDFELHLASGLALTPSTTPTCSSSQFSIDNCPATSLVGSVSTVATVEYLPGKFDTITIPGSAYVLAGGSASNYTLGIVARPANWSKMYIKQQVTTGSTISGGQLAKVTNLPRTTAYLLLFTKNITIKSVSVNYQARSGSTSAGPFFVTNPSTCTPAKSTGKFTPYSGGAVTKTSSFTPTGCGGDTTPPVFTASCTPSGSSSSCSWTANEPVAGVTCALAGPTASAASACASPKVYSTLSNGAYTFTVSGSDTAGNPGSAAATFAISTPPPTFSVSCTPGGSTLTCSWTTSEPVTDVTCSLSGVAPSPATPCTSPKSYSALPDGGVTFTVSGKDADGNYGTGTLTRTIDSTPPTFPTSCSVVYPNATCQFSSSEPVQNVRCTLVGPRPSAEAPCTSPKLYTNLADGNYTFTVRGEDLAGNTGQANATFTVLHGDPAPPICQVTGNSASCSWVPLYPASTSTCSLSGPISIPSQFCTSPKLYTNLPTGNYVFTVVLTDAAGNLATIATTFVIADIIPPSFGPSCTTSGRSASCSFFPSEPVTGVACSLSGAATVPPAPCASPKSYTGLANGTYTFTVSGLDASGNSGSSSTQFSINVDDIAPTFSPSCTTSGRRATCSFFPSEPVVNVVCSLSGVTTSPSVCTSPVVYDNLANGTYFFTVSGVDLSGNPGTSQVSFTINVDDLPPTFTTSCTRTGSTASCTFLASEPVTNYRCSLSGPVSFPEEPCTSPKTYTGLADGAYTFTIRGQDAANNPGVGTATFVVSTDDTFPPTFAPSCVVTGFSAVCTWSSSEPVSDVTCALAGAGTSPASPCTSPKTYTSLPNGAYTFTVRGRDAAGNYGTSTTTFFVNGGDVFGPVCSPSASSAVCTFAASLPMVSTTCTLVGPVSQAATACTSPKVYTGLTDGVYTFTVRGTDPNGNTHSSSTNFVFEGPSVPNTTITGDPLPGNTNGAPIYSFASSMGGGTFECRATAQPSGTPGAYTACTSGNPFPTILAGPNTYRIDVRACNPAPSNCDPTPATAFVYVDTRLSSANATVTPSTTQAQAHPNITSTVQLIGGLDPKSVQVKLPPGLNGALTGADKCTLASAAAGTCASTAPGSLIGSLSGTGVSTRDGVLTASGSLYLTEGPTSPLTVPANQAAPAGVALDMVAPNGLGNIRAQAAVVIQQSNTFPSTIATTGGTATPGAFVNTSQGEIRQVIDVPSIPRKTDSGNRFHITDVTMTLQGATAHGSGTFPLVTNPSTCPVTPQQFYGDGTTYTDTTNDTNTGTTVPTVRVNYPVTGCSGLPFNPTASYQFFQPTDIRPTSQFQPADTAAVGTFDYSAPTVTATSLLKNNDPYELDPDTSELIPGSSTQMGLAGLTASVNLPVGNSPIGKLVAYLPQAIGVNFEALGSAAQRCPGSTVSTTRMFTGVCPTVARVGTMTITTPLLSQPVVAKVMVAGTTPVPSFGIQLDPTLSANNPSGTTLRLTGLNNTVTAAPGCADGVDPEVDRAFWCGTRIFSTFSNLPDIPLTSVELDISGAAPRPTSSPQLNPMSLATSDQGDTSCKKFDTLRTVLSPLRGGSDVVLNKDVDFETC